MALSTYIRNWTSSLDRRWALYLTLRRKAAARRLATRLRLEVLEERYLLSVYTVTSNADSGSGTLRDAITQANNTTSGITAIDFAIGTSGSKQTISLLSQLPALTANGVTINGLSQGGTGNTTQLITLDGTNAGVGSDGILLNGSSDIVSGLIIQNFNGFGIDVETNASSSTIGGTTAGEGNVLSGNGQAIPNSGGGVFISASGVQVQGNYIGTDISGTKAAGNNNVGIEVQGTYDTIGGTATGARNIISGNNGGGVGITGSNVQVLGNFVGTDVTGANALANTGNGIGAGNNNIIGGTVAGAGNVVSGNGNYGIQLGSGDSVQGNYIGTDVSGSKGVANSIGIEVDGPSNIIGGMASGARNVISGNTAYGMQMTAFTGSLVEGNYIGTDVSGTKGVANSVGIFFVGTIDATIGGTSSAARNIISGNSNDGILFEDGANGIQVMGNYIGTDVSGTKAVANNIGVEQMLNMNAQSPKNNTIGGTAKGDGNIISGNTTDGVKFNAVDITNLLEGNYIGTDYTGSKAVANSIGVEDFASANSIGGTGSGAGNVISGNISYGVKLDSNVSGALVQGNYIGTDHTGSKVLANSIGVEVEGTKNNIGGHGFRSRQRHLRQQQRRRAAVCSQPRWLHRQLGAGQLHRHECGRKQRCGQQYRHRTLRIAQPLRIVQHHWRHGFGSTQRDLWQHQRWRASGRLCQSQSGDGQLHWHQYHLWRPGQ